MEPNWAQKTRTTNQKFIVWFSEIGIFWEF